MDYLAEKTAYGVRMAQRLSRYSPSLIRVPAFSGLPDRLLPRRTFYSWRFRATWSASSFARKMGGLESLKAAMRIFAQGLLIYEDADPKVGFCLFLGREPCDISTKYHNIRIF